MPDELAPQWADCRDFFEAFGWAVVASDSLEADDLLGTYARREAEAGGRALILTGDRDMYQCASDAVTVLYVRTGGKGAEQVTPDGVRERYGINPEQVPDFIALRGDPSDGLPGAKGVGPKTAAELLRRHGSLEALLDAAIRERAAKAARGADRGPRGAARLQGHRDPARRRRRSRPPTGRRLGRGRSGGRGARHEPAGRAAAIGGRDMRGGGAETRARGAGSPSSPAWTRASISTTLLDLRRGDAHIIRNAGGLVSDDALRSLSASQRLLRTEEIVVVMHRGCGLQGASDEELRRVAGRRRGPAGLAARAPSPTSSGPCARASNGCARAPS